MNPEIDDSSDTSPLSVCFHPVRPMEVEQPPGELEWSDFVDSLRSDFLPGEGQQRFLFDQTLRFEISDPHATDGGEGLCNIYRDRWPIGICCSSTCCRIALACCCSLVVKSVTACGPWR